MYWFIFLLKCKSHEKLRSWTITLWNMSPKHHLRNSSFNIPRPTPYFREIWDHKIANIECIQKSIYNFDWIRAFQNWNCKEKCKILSETLLNIFHNFIPLKIKKIDHKTPEWINRSIKLSLKKRSKLTKRYHSNPTANDKEALDFQGKECTSLIIESKERFIAKMSISLISLKYLINFDMKAWFLS